ncbi:hypothetical protein TWF281_006894 [Arthrobotrys megalospora]
MANKEPQSKAIKKIIQKPLVVSEAAKLCSLTTVSDSSNSSAGMEVDMQENVDSNQIKTSEACANKSEKENDVSPVPELKKDQGSEIGPSADKDQNEKTKPKKGKGITSVKKGSTPKPKAKKEEGGDTEPKVKGKRGRKRKDDTVDTTREAGGETKPKPKRTKNSNGPSNKNSKKLIGSNLVTLELRCAPPSPPPPTEAELAEAVAKSAGEEARKERLKSIPYYYEEMKEIFDYLCDRGVYWKSDLPKNKRYSNRDTKLLEKEVKKNVLEVLGKYPKEKEVVEAFERKEEKLKILGDQEGNDDFVEGKMAMDAKGESAMME